MSVVAGGFQIKLEFRSCIAELVLQLRFLSHH